MKILVFIKQVPETSRTKLDKETGTVIRDAAISVINPLDLFALETALRLKEERGAHITVLSMGPPSAEKQLREALAMGADRAALITDRKFAGSDTWATSLILAAAVRKLGDFDLLLAGERAVDGDTGQVGPNLASRLNLPLGAYVRRILDIGDTITVERVIDDGWERLRLRLPALLTVVKEIGVPRLPTLSGKKYARQQEIIRFGFDDLGLPESQVGLNGSPTRVVRVATPRVSRNGKIIRLSGNAPQVVDEVVAFLKERAIL